MCSEITMIVLQCTDIFFRTGIQEGMKQYFCLGSNGLMDDS
jgi:hypothetical protein